MVGGKIAHAILESYIMHTSLAREQLCSLCRVQSTSKLIAIEKIVRDCSYAMFSMHEPWSMTVITTSPTLLW